MAQWDGQLDENGEREVEVTIDKLKASSVDATKGKACAPKLQPCSLDFEAAVGDHVHSGDVGLSTAADKPAVEASASEHATEQATDAIMIMAVDE